MPTSPIGPPPPLMSPSTSPVDLALYEIPHPNPYLFDLTIETSQLSGIINHVNNVEYVRWIDRAAELHGDAVGYSRETLLAGDMMWFVARHEVDYCAEVWAEDGLRIATWVRNFHKVKSLRDTVIIREKDQTIVCRASTLWVLVTLSTRRARRIPPEMIQAFDPLTLPETLPARS